MSELIESIAKLLPVDRAFALVEPLLAEPSKAVGETLTDQVQFWQWKNRVRIAEKFRRIVETKQIAARVLPPSFLIPLIRDCGDVEDENLQDAWARLLASAVENESAEHVGFATLLKQMAPSDARVLQALIREGPFARTQRVAALTKITGFSENVVLTSFQHFDFLGFYEAPKFFQLRPFALKFCRHCFCDPLEVDAFAERQADVSQFRSIDSLPK